MAARFVKPLYEGDVATVEADAGGDGALTLTLRNEDDVTCATGRAALGTGVAPDPAAYASAPLPEVRPPADDDSLAVGRVLGSLEFGFHAHRAGEYLVDIDDDHPLYRELGVAHPGWLLLAANLLLTANVRLGPWIHVESDVDLMAAVR